MPPHAALVADALVSLVHPGLDEVARVDATIAAGAGPKLVAAARHHRLTGLLRPVVEGLPSPPPELVAELWAADSLAARAHQRALAELKKLGLLLEGIPWLTLKGPVLATLHYPRPQMRPYRDVDILVPPEAFATVVGRLESSGYEVLDRNWTAIRQQLAGQLHLRRRSGVGVDLHWDLIYGRRIRECFALDPATLFEHTREVRIADLVVRTLDPAATVMHLCVHACREGGDLLIWMADISASTRAIVAWDDVVRLARTARVHLLVGTMLARSVATTGAPVPEWVIAELVPARAHRWILHVLDRHFPPQRTGPSGSPATLLARATRNDVASTWAEVGRGLARRAMGAARHRSLGRRNTRDDPTHPGSTLYVSGEASDRAAYLAAVTETKRTARWT